MKTTTIKFSLLIMLCMLSFIACRKDKTVVPERAVDVDSNLVGNWQALGNEVVFNLYSSFFNLDSNNFGFYFERNSMNDYTEVEGEVYINNNYVVMGDSLRLKINEYPQVLSENDTLAVFYDVLGYTYYVYSAKFKLNGWTYYKVEYSYE